MAIICHVAEEDKGLLEKGIYMKDILKFFTIFSRRQKKKFIFIFIVMMIGAALESVGIGAILPLISLLGQPDYLVSHPDVAAVTARLGINSHKELICTGAGSLIVFYFLKNVYAAWGVDVQRKFAMKYQMIYSKEIMATYLAKPYAFHLNHNTALLLRNVNVGATMIFNNMFMPVCYLLSEVFTVIAIWLMLIVVDPFTAIVVAGFLAALIYSIIKIFRRKITQQGCIQKDASTEYLKWINQGLGAIKETKILRRESFFLEEFSEGYKKYAKAVQIYGFINALPRIIIELLVVSGILSLILIKIILGNEPQEIIPLLGLLAMAAFRLMPSVNRIVGYYNTMKSQMPFFDDMYDVLIEIKDRLYHGENIISAYNDEKMSFSDKVEIRDLFFHYPGGDEIILDGVSFEIGKGKFVGIVGPSGAGKTTFVDILLGLLKPTGGRILCDGHDINDNIRAWQGNLAYVPQDIYLLDSSIRENIALGVAIEDIDDDLLNRVIAMAELADLVDSLPDGLDTFVGERGVKLSGGQRQRIGIARALYQRPEILVLDEATSALDNETEKSITETILKFKGKITIIAIAHRVSTLEECDYKIKFEAGKAEVIN